MRKWLCFSLLCLSFPALLLSADAPAIELIVDASNAAGGIVSVKEYLAARPGPTRLHYAKWLPGEHSPSGPVVDVVSFHVSAGGQEVAWRRDPNDMYSIDVVVPAGASSLALEFSYLLNAGSPISARPSASPRVAFLNWYWLSWYIDGPPLSGLSVEARVLPPASWSVASSMLSHEVAAWTIFAPTSLDQLFEQPLLLGAHVKRYALTPGAATSHELDVAADSPEAVEISSERLAAVSRLIDETSLLTGVRHYERYHFLLGLSALLGSNGLEHHQCSENRAAEDTFLDDTSFAYFGSLLPHEYFHSWNGKYRRPQIMLSPHDQEVIQGDLLWVYEGLTEFYGNVLAVRCGLMKPDFYRDQLAANAALYSRQRGRAWRSLVDTGTAIQLQYMASKSGSNLRRSADVYSEGELIWLEVDSRIRALTGGTRSLDDFVRLFFGDAGSGPVDLTKVRAEVPSIKPYTEADLYAALSQIAPFDWAAFFHERVYRPGAPAPTQGLESSGWSLVFTEKENEALSTNEKAGSGTDFNDMLGLSLDETAHVIEVDPESPAGKAGVLPGAVVVGVNGRRYSKDLLLRALSASTATGEVSLSLEEATFLRTVKLPYSGGLRYPHLLRSSSPTESLSLLLKPRLEKH